VNRRHAPDLGLSLFEGGMTGDSGGAKRTRRRLAVGAARRKGHCGRYAPIAGIMHNTSEWQRSPYIMHTCMHCGVWTTAIALSSHIKNSCFIDSCPCARISCKTLDERLELIT
jgi:hypothetical protein